jgi:Flp pilus assembly pilin Flp
VTGVSYGRLWRHLAWLAGRAKSEDGQALGEYALVLTLVAMGAVLALTALGVAIGGFWQPLTDIMGL